MINLMYFFRYSLFLLALLIPSLGYAKAEKADPTKDFLAICAIFKDEAPWLKEWIEYHQLVGVNHFYLYNNGSRDSFIAVLRPYILRGIVTLVDWPDQIPSEKKAEPFAWVHYTQMAAYEDGCKRATSKAEWLALIDIDEFMVPITASTMTEILENHAEASIVTLYWHLFGTSHLERLPENTLLIEALHLTCAPNSLFHTIVKKIIIRPEHYAGFTLPPHNCVVKPGLIVATLEKNEAQLNHYMNRTIEYFLSHKVKSKEKMDNIKLTSEQIEAWKDKGNEIEDPSPHIQRFVPELRKRMCYP